MSAMDGNAPLGDADGLQRLSDEMFGILVDNGVAESFGRILRARAEYTSRVLEMAPSADVLNRLVGKISICHELADGAAAALEASRTRARVAEADRIRQQLVSQGGGVDVPAESTGVLG